VLSRLLRALPFRVSPGGALPGIGRQRHTNLRPLPPPCAQAQECAYHKAVVDKLSASTVAKLAKMVGGCSSSRCMPSYRGRVQEEGKRESEQYGSLSIGASPVLPFVLLIATLTMITLRVHSHLPSSGCTHVRGCEPRIQRTQSRQLLCQELAGERVGERGREGSKCTTRRGHSSQSLFPPKTKSLPSRASKLRCAPLNHLFHAHTTLAHLACWGVLP